MRKPDKSNYQSLNYSDDMMDKFGFFQIGYTGKRKWSKLRGIVDSQTNRNIVRFNIWNEDDSPRQIIYYTSVSHPRNLMSASLWAVEQWNQVFKELVFELKKE